jgi:hypothetical protein
VSINESLAKRALGLNNDGETSRVRAIETWPDHADLFARKKDDNRAEAALLGLYGLREGAMSERERLPNRRAAEMFDFEHNGRPWTLTVGRFGDGRIAEVFLSTNKLSAVGELAAEAAIVASLALQSGCPLETLRHALDGRDAGPLGAALAIIGEATR